MIRATQNMKNINLVNLIIYFKSHGDARPNDPRVVNHGREEGWCEDDHVRIDCLAKEFQGNRSRASILSRPCVAP